MNIPAFSIKNYQLTLTAFVLLLIAGLFSFTSMPRQEDPVLDIPNTIVVAVYPGANPRDIESQVVDPIEEAIKELDDLKELRTTVRDGAAVTEVEFEFGVDPDDKYDEVQRQINQLKDVLPSDLYSLEARQINTNTVNIFQIALISETAEYKQLLAEAELIKDEIESVSGVRKVELEAYPEEEVRLALDPIKMTQANLSIDDIEQAIAGTNANIPGGAIKVSNKLFAVKTSGAYEDLDQIRQTVVGVHQGKLVYLKDVADVHFTYEDDRWLARYNGKPAMYINVTQKEGMNIFDVSDPVKAQLADYRLPTDMQLAYVFDQSAGVQERVSGFIGNLGQGILLVGVVIFLLLGVRSASLVMLAIPLSIMIGLLAVDGLGYALQQMSIAGLIVALGLLVDNSIAITENIERLLGKGLSPTQAAADGTQQLVTPIGSATLTTVLAFVPIVLMPDVTGAFIGALPITVIATLVASYAIAITLTPFLASRFLKPKQSGDQNSWLFRQLGEFIKGPYTRTLNWVNDHKWLTLGMAGLAFVGAMALFPLVGVSFFPKAEKPQLRITVNLPKGSNLDATDRAVTYVEQVLSEYEEVDYYAANVGHGNPRIYYNIASTSYRSTYGELFVTLKSYEVDAFYELLNELRERLGTYTAARIDVREFVQGPPSKAPVEIQIQGNDLEQLQALSRKVERTVRQTPGAINVSNPLRENSTDLHFEINRDKAMLFGVPLFTVDKTIRSFVNGNTVGVFRDTDGEDYNIVLRYEGGEDFSLKDFDRLSIPTMTGNFLPLRQVANIQFEEAPSQIEHYDNKRVTTVLADLDNGYTLDNVISDIDSQLAQEEWPQGYSYTYLGDLANRNSSFGGMGIASLLAILLIVGVLIIQFRSFTQPLIILTALPLAMIGSILALFITGIAFSFTAFIGLTSLIGIAINNSIVLVDYANAVRAEGASIRDAAIQAGQVRFTPIVATTLTTILGLLPLTLNGGSLWAPMGWTIIGGLLTSTTLVLLIVPILYQLFTRETAVAAT
ncbi:MAG: efflux RND transporter permease subunit [Bacteroidota bacterium]